MESLDRRHVAGQQYSRRRADSIQAIAVSATPTEAEFTTTRAHPCHAHELVRVDSLLIYSHVEPAGAWYCNRCERRGSVLQQRYPWHCVSPPGVMPPCQYDMCDECFFGSMHPLHEHRLRLTDANVTYAGENGIWACEYCNLDRMSTKERYPYHCAQCRFDLCVRCYEGIRHPLHPHRLQPANSDLVYGEHGGLWFCDLCHKSRKQLRESHMWHCVACKFDLCISCASGSAHAAHGHKLYLADADVAYANFSGLWSCDTCGVSRGASGQRFMRHCAECSFDLCNACFGHAAGDAAAGDGGAVAGKEAKLKEDPAGHVITRGKIPSSKSGTLRVGSIGDQYESLDFESDPSKEAQLMVDMATACEDKMLAQKKDHTSADKQSVSQVPAAGRSHGDGQLCLLCMDRVRNATFVHGTTGHLACCMRCAKRLHANGDACPVCRQPIGAVIEQFIA